VASTKGCHVADGLLSPLRWPPIPSCAAHPTCHPGIWPGDGRPGTAPDQDELRKDRRPPPPPAAAPVALVVVGGSASSGSPPRPRPGSRQLRPGQGSLPPRTVEPVEPQKCDRREPHAVIGRRQALRLWPAPGARHHPIEWAGALRGAAGSRAKDSPTTAGDPGPGFRVARKPWQTLTLPEGFRAVSPDQRIQENPGSDCLKPWIPPAICQRPLPRPPPGSCEG
jgi:hypothetical protein